MCCETFGSNCLLGMFLMGNTAHISTMSRSWHAHVFISLWFLKCFYLFIYFVHPKLWLKAWKFDPHLGPPHVVLITEGIKTCNIFHPIFKRKNKEHYFWETSAAPGESFLSVHMTFAERTTYMTSRVCTGSFYITAATEVIALTAVVLL